MLADELSLRGQTRERLLSLRGQTRERLLSLHVVQVMKDNPKRIMYMIGSDQKFEENIISCQLTRPAMYQKLVVIRDLLHVQMHLLIALWEMTRQSVMFGFVYQLGFQKLGKASRYVDFEVDDFNYYRAFTQAWIDGVHEYYCELAGHTLVADQLEMMDVLEHNKGHLEVYTTMCWMLHFSELRRAVQQGGNEVS